MAGKPSIIQRAALALNFIAALHCKKQNVSEAWAETIGGIAGSLFGDYFRIADKSGAIT